MNSDHNTNQANLSLSNMVPGTIITERPISLPKRKRIKTRPRIRKKYADTTDDDKNEPMTVRFRLESAITGGKHKMNLNKQVYKLDNWSEYAGTTTYVQEDHSIAYLYLFQ